jgi:hypothetical protein
MDHDHLQLLLLLLHGWSPVYPPPSVLGEKLNLLHSTVST